MENKKIVAWWRYPAAVIAFIASYFILPIIIAVVWGIVNFLTPAFYRNSAEWITICADLVGFYVGFSLVDAILLEQKYIFQAVFAALVAAASLFMALLVYAFSTNESIIPVVGFLLGAIVSFVFVGISCKKHAKQTQVESKEDKQ